MVRLASSARALADPLDRDQERCRLTLGLAALELGELLVELVPLLLELSSPLAIGDRARRREVLAREIPREVRRGALDALAAFESGRRG